MIKSISAKQLEYIRLGDSAKTLCLAGGAIRSGKTFASVAAFCIWLLKYGRDHDHALVGQSVETAMRNCGFDLINFFRSFGIPADYTRSVGSRIAVDIGTRIINIWLIGSSDDRATKRLQGSTLKGILFDEIALCSEQIFYSAFSRLSVEGSKLFGTYNPESPRHWLKTKVIDRIDAWNGADLHFTFEDNPALEQEIVDRYKASFTGHFRQRMIEGKWAGASGLVFPEYEVVNRQPKEPLAFALDWGVASVFCALGFTSGSGESICVSELYHDARLAGHRSEVDHLNAFTSWASALGATTGTIWVDPNTPASFKRYLMDAGFSPRNANNDVLAGITTAQTQLQQGKIKIHRRCQNLLEELSGYSWDEKGLLRGTDAPVKSDDHAVDALRYYAYKDGNLQLKAFPIAMSRTLARIQTPI